MPKRVFIVHGWEGFPEEGWFPWLKQQLTAAGFAVTVPALPDTRTPRIEKWVPALANAVGLADEQTFFVGHSLGCQAIARYLAGLPSTSFIGGAVFVAGFFKHLSGLENEPDVQETDRHWLTTPLDLTDVRKKIKKSIAIFSDDDPWVPLDNQDDFRDKLGSEIRIVHAHQHFTAEDDWTELPEVLTSVLQLQK